MNRGWWSRYIASLVLGVSAVAVATVGGVSHLPTLAVAVVAGVLVFAALLSTRRWPPSKSPAKLWLLLAVGVIFLVGGAVGVVRSVQQNWHWTDRLPLAVPLALGTSIVWLVLKFRHKLAPESTRKSGADAPGGG